MLLRSKRQLPEFDSDQNRDRRRLKFEPSSSKSASNSYKSRVLKVLNNKDQSNRLTCELRMALFVAAAQDTNRDTLLHPFPPCFIPGETDWKDYAEVTKAIDKIPGLENIKDSTDLPDLTWELLDWIFNQNATTTALEPLVKDITVKIEELKLTTGLTYLPIPDNSNVFMFKITHPLAKPEFAEAKEKYGSKYAFHGSRTQNFHSILHRGLMCSFNRMGAYGHGTYMSPHVGMSKSYSRTDGGWSRSSFGNKFACVVIVEFVMSPDTHEFNNDGVYVCDNDDHMQISHLILYRQ